MNIQAAGLDPELARLAETKVREAVAKSLDVELEDVRMDSTFEGDLGAESLDLLDMAFMLEREFKIQFPRTNILERATEYFGEEALLTDGGVITDFGLELLAKGMPELDADRLRPGLTAAEVMSMITVASFARIVTRLLEVKQQASRECPECKATMQESDIMPEFVCPECKAVKPLPSGDDVLLQDLVDLSKKP